MADLTQQAISSSLAEQQNKQGSAGSAATPIMLSVLKTIEHEATMYVPETH